MVSFSQVTDFTRPVCQVDLTANCPQDCSQATWQLSANLTDGNGTGIVLVTLQQGNGTLNTSSYGAGITFASYNASCCSEVVELVMVDDVGNAGVCSASIRGLSSATTPQTPTANTTVMQIATTSQTPIATTYSAGHCLNLSIWLWPIVMLPLLYLKV